MKYRLALFLCLTLLYPLGAASREARFWSGQTGNFDFYMLALSWSPTYCAVEGSRRGSAQCDIGKKIGFTVHGLWPQYFSGYPSNCSLSERGVPGYVIDEMRDIFPDTGLARYQWRKHGSCAGNDPASYFRATRAAYNRVKIPERFRNLKQAVSIPPIEIERAFAAANPGLRPDMMRIMCQRGQLQEIRICFDRNIRGFYSCGRADRSNCGFMNIRVNPAQ